MTHNLYIASWHFVASEMSPVLQEQTHLHCYTFRCKPSLSQHISMKIGFHKILLPAVKKKALLLHFVLLVQTFPYAITMCQFGTLIFLKMPQTCQFDQVLSVFAKW